MSQYPYARPSETLKLHAARQRLVAYCRRNGCTNRRDPHTELLVRAFGAHATLGSIAARLRCHRCGMRGARIEARYIGREEARRFLRRPVAILDPS